MTKKFDEKNMAKSRRVCEAMDRENGRSKLTGRERQILDMWPRFEDDEYVWFGNGVANLSGAITVEAIEFSRGMVCVKDAEDGDWDTSIRALHPLKRPAPKVLDADGVEIEVGDTVWYRSLCTMGSTRKATVAGFDEHSLYGLLVTLKDEAGKTWYIHPKKITHTPPDSWERLEEDVNTIVTGDGMYHRLNNYCNARDLGGDDVIALTVCDIIRRAKALAGVEAGQ